MTAIARIVTEPAPQDEPAPLAFIRVPELALKLPAQQLAVLIGLLRFCWNGPRCRPSQDTLAAVIAQPPSNVRRGLRGLIARQVIAKDYWRDRQGVHCAYTIAAGYWISQNTRISATSATCGGEEEDSYPTGKSQKSEGTGGASRPPVRPPSPAPIAASARCSRDVGATSPKHPKTPLPENWLPPTEDLGYALKHSNDDIDWVERQIRRFQKYFGADGAVSGCWELEWRRWFKRSLECRERRGRFRRGARRIKLAA